MIFNTHSHINDKLDNLKELVDECIENNVDLIGVVGYDYDSSLRAIQASLQSDNVYAIVGLQPNEVSSFDGNYDKFIELFKELNQEGRTIIMITHDETIAKSASRIVRILDGNVLEEDTYV